MKLAYSIILALTFTAQVAADSAPNIANDLAPGYGELAFSLPAPGSYALSKLGTAGDGDVIDSEGKAWRLHQLMGDKLVLLSFIYSTCSDVNGCPLATTVLRKLYRHLQNEPQLQDKVRLLTLSFNPQHDTPEQMREFGRHLQGGMLDWRFLTTANDIALQPILQQYPQQVQKVFDAQGKFTGTFNHNLRVYLIDKDKQLRNIYNASFLHADTLLNDVKTLVLATTNPTANSQADKSARLLQAGDDKAGYEHATYQTNSVSLQQRQGVALDWDNWLYQKLLGLPPPPIPEDNSLTAAKINLGRKLFYDRRLSFNNTFSCALCHIPEQGFTSNEMATSVGVEGRSVRRNAPTLYNVAYAQHLFHDGREQTLEQQVWGPLLANNEMGNVSIGAVITKLKQSPDYAGLFEVAFERPASMETVGMALASYERALNAADAPFDHWYFKQQANALNTAAQRGFALFSGKAGCSACHRLDKQQALFMDQHFHNTGIGYRASMSNDSVTRKVQIAPGKFVDVDNSAIQSVAAPQANDLGRYEVTQNPGDRWRYKTPSLRNIALTAPYMHDGSLSTLAEVVAFYNVGGVANENLDPLMKPLNLTNTEQQDLIAFLQSLTSSQVPQLVSDAFSAPVGDLE